MSLINDLRLDTGDDTGITYSSISVAPTGIIQNICGETYLLLTDLRLDIGDDDGVDFGTVNPPISNTVTTTPGLAADNGVARFDGAGGTTIEGSLATLDDIGNFSTPGDITAGTALITSGAFCLTPTIITVAGPVSVAPTDSIIMLNKTIGAATTVTLPSIQKSGRILIIKDLKGDANINQITILTSGGETIDGLAGFIISQSYQSLTLIYNSFGWSVI